STYSCWLSVVTLSATTVPSSASNQCRSAVLPISALRQCHPLVTPNSVAQQCPSSCPSVLPIHATSSVPISPAYQCSLINAHQC
ncbi:unnamed protein product, partial [Staurois parvus]